MTDRLEAAAIDELTGVASRSAALDQLQQQLTASETLHCLVIDVDNFERLNALLGSDTADEILVEVAATLTDILEGFLIGRLSGDQFLAFGEEPPAQATRTSLTALEVETSIGAQAIQLSIGQTSADLSGHSVDEILRDAFAALRLAKDQGKQRVVVATPQIRLTQAIHRRIANEARGALENNELDAWSQPIFDLKTDKVAGFELLARWPHPDGEKGPGLFIPIVESLGISDLLGEFMIREATSLLERLSQLGHPDLFVTVNISARHFAEPLLASLLAVQLKRRSIAPHRLIVELTESQALPDSPGGNTAVERLRALGVGVASDDVGAGWSSLTQMLRTRFTHVKTDRALIEATAEPGGIELIQAIRKVAEGAGQIPIAEGIETEADLAAVRQAGYVLGQGWLLRRPTTIEEAIALLQ